MAVKNEVVEQSKKNAELLVNNSFIDALSKQLKEKEEFGLTFPADYNPTNALMGGYLMLKEIVDKDKKPVLESCSQSSIANSLLDMVTLGLNVQKKQGYFIAYGGKVQFQKSYFGNITIARRFGLKRINADVIYKGDVFKYHKEDGMTVIDKHEQNFENMDNKNIIGAYAVAIMEDGTKVVEIMNMNQLKQAWNQRQGGYKEADYDTHVKFREEMSKKTVSNRLLKRVTNTYGDASAFETYNKLEEIEDVDITKENVDYDIEQNANSEEFPTTQEESTIVEDVPEPVEGEVVQNDDVPDCFK